MSLGGENTAVHTSQAFTADSPPARCVKVLCPSFSPPCLAGSSYSSDHESFKVLWEEVASDSRVEPAGWGERRAQVPCCQQKPPINRGRHIKPLLLICGLDLRVLLLCPLSFNFWPCFCSCVGTSDYIQPFLLSWVQRPSDLSSKLPQWPDDTILASSLYIMNKGLLAVRDKVKE